LLKEKENHEKEINVPRPFSSIYVTLLFQGASREQVRPETRRHGCEAVEIEAR
jgi:hypothetical protein